jgi:serine/threonine protein kinase
VAKQSDWEKVTSEPVGSGGQSTVFLVRRPERRAAREKSYEIIKALSGQGLYEQTGTALAFARATMDIAREDFPSELGALKIFKTRAEGPEAEQQALGRMRSEIAILQQNRPGLLKLLDSNESERWIVTEYCHQGTLERHLHKYKGKAAHALGAFLPLVRTAGELHREANKEPVVHRDIKPQNIFVGAHGELLLGDFGIVFLPNEPERLSFTGESVGPRDFMPPWVFLDEKPTITPAFDVYMLGKVLWCMVTGKLKLHREDFLDARLDVTKLYPNDPNMHMVNDILKKSVVTRERDCLKSARDLWQMVGTYWEMIERGGQLWEDDVPKPCRVCGRGFYRNDGTVSHGGLRLWTSGSESKQLPVHVLSCDVCGHVQVFKNLRP